MSTQFYYYRFKDSEGDYFIVDPYFLKEDADDFLENDLDAENMNLVSYEEVPLSKIHFFTAHSLHTNIDSEPGDEKRRMTSTHWMM